MNAPSSFKKIGECLYRYPSSGTYYALLKIRGKQIRRSLETDNLSEARRKLKDFRRDQAKIDPDAGKVTVASLCNRQLEVIKIGSPKTIARKTLILDRVRKKWGDMDASRVRQSDIRSWLTTWEQKVPTYNLHLQGIRELFKQAVDDRLLASSPVDGIKQRKLSRPIRETASPAEFKAIVESIRSQKLADTFEESADMVEFLGLAGLGQAEASSLTWGDVNFESSQLIVFRHKTRTGFTVPIYPQLRPLLEKRLGQATKASGGRAPLPFMKVFSVANAKKALEAACDRLGLKRYSARALRRMFISLAIERGVDVKVISQWQGHRDGGKLILDTYSHVRPAHSEQMAKLMTEEIPTNVVPMTVAAA